MNEFVGLNEYDAQGDVVFSRPMSAAAARRVCLISRSPSSWLGLQNGGFEPSLTIEVTDNLHAAVRLLASRRSGCSLVIVHFDDFSAQPDTIDLLRRLRARSPNLPVILLSSSFRANDLSQERLAIADVSLVSPIADSATLSAALSVAVLNNAAWRKRRRSLMLEKARQMSELSSAPI